MLKPVKEREPQPGAPRCGDHRGGAPKPGGRPRGRVDTWQNPGVLEPVTVLYQECRVELAGDSPELRLELTCDDEPLVYCFECWEREFGESEASAG